MSNRQPDSVRKRNRLLAALYAFILAAFTVFVLLDTFIIARPYTVSDSTGTQQADTASGDSASLHTGTTSSTTATSSENTAGNEASAGTAQSEQGTTASGNTSAETASSDNASQETPVITATTYDDGQTTITISTQRVNNTTVYVADITLSDTTALKTAFAQNTYGKNVTATTSSIASEVSAILAINGDYYGAQESGYVIRNGVLYRSTARRGAEDLVIWQDGSFSIVSESSISAQELLDQGAWQVLSFGPAIIEDGSVSVSAHDEVGKAMASNPRTAIGIISAGHYVFVVSDGRTSESTGLSLKELANFMETLGVQTAYNLDGGGSSTMVFNGTVINNPTTNGHSIKERKVSDIVYIG